MKRGLFRNSRKTERGAGQFLVRLGRAAPFALLILATAAWLPLLSQTVTAGGGFLGVGVGPTEPGRNPSDAPNRVGITRVQEGSPADKAGLKMGDIVLEYNGKAIENTMEFVDRVHQTAPGHRVKLVVSRDGSTKTLWVTLGTRRESQPRVVTPSWAPPTTPTAAPNLDPFPEPIDFPPMPAGSILGVEIETLPPQLAEFFGVKSGVLVRSVTKGSAAAHAGIKAGDVITKVDGSRVENIAEAYIAIHASGPHGTFPLSIMRDHRELTLAVAMPAEGSAP
jgi:serine protease Do